jgi:hypothetical protein
MEFKDELCDIGEIAVQKGIRGKFIMTTNV